MSPTHRRLISLFVIAGTICSVSAQVKRTLKPEDYGQWEMLVNQQISGDGRWLSYELPRVDEDSRLIIKNSDGPEKAEIPSGSEAVFSDDSKWCGYLIGVPKAIADKLKEEKKPILTKFGLKNLSTGAEITYEAIQSFKFLKGSHYLLLACFRGPSKVDGGSDTVVVNLQTGESLSIGNVVTASANDKGDLIAFSIQSDSGQRGVQLLDPNSNVLRTVVWGKDEINSLGWAGKADVLAFLIGKADDKKDGVGNVAMVVSDLRKPRPSVAVFDPNQQPNFPKGKRIAEFGGFVLNEDGTALAMGLSDWKDKVKPSGKPEDKPGVEIWSTKAIRVIPQQKRQAGRDKLKTSLAVWHPKSNDFKIISDGKDQTAFLLSGFGRAMLIDPNPYQSPITNGISYHDVYLVDTQSGIRTKVIEKSQWVPVPSRKGKYLAYFDRKNWWLYDIQAEKKTNLTESVKVPFEDVELDLTLPEKPPVGSPTWLANDDGFIVEDQYDSYLVRTGTNSITELTNGRKDKQIHRLLEPETKEDGLSIQEPFYFSILDDRTKASGFYKVDAKGKGHVLVLDNFRFSGLTKAKNVDRMLFTLADFDKSPNIYLTNTEMAQSKPESKTNPQQAQFSWGKSELITYKNRWGVELHGTLVYPADYMKGRQYPMVTYIYEKLSNNLHSYSGPVDWSAYNVQVLSQNGYFVFMPDIVYKPRNPGKSAVDCLEPAVEAVLAKRVGVDSTKIGLMGHSWGAYQTAYVTTVSKAFAVGVAGAPLTELTSMYNSYYWNSGVTDQQLFETGQGRMEVPFWEDPKVYFENSPVWQSAKRTSPILITFGDQDGAVDWHQGQYLYNTLRRMGKNAVMLVYAGENHGLVKRANQLDYAHRVRHFLDVYLKNAKPQPWVNEDIPLLKQLDGQ